MNFVEHNLWQSDSAKSRLSWYMQHPRKMAAVAFFVLLAIAQSQGELLGN